MNQVEKRKTLVLLALLILTCFTAHVLGADRVDFEVTADFFGKYLWRGQNLDDASGGWLGRCRVWIEGSWV
jgi:hypothetical protein